MAEGSPQTPPSRPSKKAEHPDIPQLKRGFQTSRKKIEANPKRYSAAEARGAEMHDTYAGPKVLREELTRLIKIIPSGSKESPQRILEKTRQSLVERETLLLRKKSESEEDQKEFAKVQNALDYVRMFDTGQHDADLPYKKPGEDPAREKKITQRSKKFLEKGRVYEHIDQGRNFFPANIKVDSPLKMVREVMKEHKIQKTSTDAPVHVESSLPERPLRSVPLSGIPAPSRAGSERERPTHDTVVARPRVEVSPERTEAEREILHERTTEAAHEFLKRGSEPKENTLRKLFGFHEMPPEDERREFEYDLNKAVIALSNERFSDIPDQEGLIHRVHIVRTTSNALAAEIAVELCDDPAFMHHGPEAFIRFKDFIENNLKDEFQREVILPMRNEDGTVFEDITPDLIDLIITTRDSLVQKTMERLLQSLPRALRVLSSLNILEGEKLFEHRMEQRHMERMLKHAIQYAQRLKSFVPKSPV